jgi:hypothetical protein
VIKFRIREQYGKEFDPNMHEVVSIWRKLHKDEQHNLYSLLNLGGIIERVREDSRRVEAKRKCGREAWDTLFQGGGEKGIPLDRSFPGNARLSF